MAAAAHVPICTSENPKGAEGILRSGGAAERAHAGVRYRASSKTPDDAAERVTEAPVSGAGRWLIMSAP